MQLFRTTTGRAFLFALALVLGTEVLLRVLSARLSKNVANINTYAAAAAKFAAHDRPGFVFLGNSLTGEGIDADKLKLPNSDGLIPSLKLTPDSSNLWDWSCIADQHLPRARAGSILFVSYGWRETEDSDAVVARRAFGLFCKPSAVLSFEWPALSLEKRLEGSFAYASMAYALHERVRNGVLTALIPSYQTQSLLLNDDQRGPSPQRSGTAAKASFTMLARLQDYAGAKGYRTIALAMPVETPIDVNPEICAFAAQRSMLVLDARHFLNLQHSDFKDTLHMTPVAASRFTTALSEQLAKLLPRTDLRGCIKLPVTP